MSAKRTAIRTRLVEARVDLGERLVEERRRACRSERLGRILVRPKEAHRSVLRPHSIRGQARRLNGCGPLL